MAKKIKFITRLLGLTLFLTFISCSEELYNIKDQHNSVDKNKISLAQFKNETNIDKVEPILSVHSKTSIASKSKSQLSDFVIDTLAIKKFISENNKITFTFRIYPLSSVAQPNEIYNLVYRKVNNIWETSIFYLKKFPKTDNKQKIFEKIERIYGGKVSNSLTSKTSSLEMCSFETTSYHCTDPGICDGSGKCDLCNLCVSTSVTYMSCSSGSGDGSGPSDPGGYSGVGGSDTDPYSYYPNNYDNPVFDDQNYINVLNRQYFWEDLDYGNQLWAIDNPVSYNQIIQYLIQNNYSDESKEFANQMIQSMITNDGYSGDGLTNDIDEDNPEYNGPKQLIPQQITLNDDSIINVIFGTTSSDNINANNEVAVDLVNAIVFALEKANSNLQNVEKISSIYISATTNGNHSSTSNHSKGTAVDISRINGVKMINLGSNNQVVALQNAFDDYHNIRENFGPFFRHKTFPNGSVNLNWPVGGHQDHIHVSVQSN